MSTKDKTEPCLARRSVDLQVLRIRKWLRKLVPALLMFGKVVRKARKDGFIESFDLAICLVMRAGVAKFETLGRAHFVAEKLSTN